MIESHWFQSSLNNAVILVGAPNIRRCSGQTRWLQSTARDDPNFAALGQGYPVGFARG